MERIEPEDPVVVIDLGDRAPTPGRFSEALPADAATKVVGSRLVVARGEERLLRTAVMGMQRHTPHYRFGVALLRSAFPALPSADSAPSDDPEHLLTSKACGRHGRGLRRRELARDAREA